MLGLTLSGWAQGEPSPEVAELAAENRELRQRVETLERQLDELRRQVGAWRGEQEAHAVEVAEIRRVQESAAIPARIESPPRSLAQRIVLSGDLAVTYFDGGSESEHPAGQFTLDDTKLYLDAEIRRGLYAFVEVDVALREGDQQFGLGEAYLELENVGAGWFGNGLGTVRIGRLDVPFGEEYQVRGPMQNPLITHSLADFWGVDEGIELFGGRGDWTYLVAIQNGSHPAHTDLTSDKAVIARVGYDPHARLHVALSAMRTGDIDPTEETLTELWWGGGFLRSIGNPATTSRFGADLLQLDAAYRWNGGHLKAAGGWVWYDDNDTVADNSRTMTHLMIEAVQDLTRDLFVAGRYSTIDAGEGYPIVGGGDFGKYLFGPFRTRDAWRFGVGLGYRVSPDFLLKFEYTFEGGTLTTGSDRDDMNQIATQAAVRF